MQKVIRSYFKHGEHCGIAKQVQGQVTDAEKDKYGNWHFTFGNDKWMASSVSVTIGDINLHEVQKVRDIAKEIQRELPNVLPTALPR